MRRILGLHPSQRYGRTVEQIEPEQGTLGQNNNDCYRKSGTFADNKSSGVETWLESYQDLLGQWTGPTEDGVYQVTGQTTTTILEISSGPQGLELFQNEIS